jgi:hypothetical protein
MARTVAIFLGAWVAISIPTAIAVGRFIAIASRLPRSGPAKLWTFEPQARGGPKLRTADTPKLWTLEGHRRAA